MERNDARMKGEWGCKGLRVDYRAAPRTYMGVNHTSSIAKSKFN